MKIVQINAEQAPALAPQIAAIHAASYSRDHFTATFGAEKLAEYNRLLIANSDVSIAALDGETVLGYIISGTSVGKGVSAFIGQNRAFLIGRFLANPRFIIEKLTWSVRNRISPQKPSLATYRLLSIATASGAQSSGVGRRLLGELERILKARNIHCYGLSVLTKNVRAIAFYKKNGFLLEKESNGSSYFTKDLL